MPNNTPPDTQNRILLLSKIAIIEKIFIIYRIGKQHSRKSNIQTAPAVLPKLS